MSYTERQLDRAIEWFGYGSTERAQYNSCTVQYEVNYERGRLVRMKHFHTAAMRTCWSIHGNTIWKQLSYSNAEINTLYGATK